MKGGLLDFDAAIRMRVAASELGAVASNEIIVDLFAGGGGATQGIEDAGLIVHECVNHCKTAIETHEANHRWTNHRHGDVWSNRPEAVAAGRPVAGLWASPDCRHFSRARGSAPVSKRVRDLAWVVVKWAKSAASPRVIWVENVPEFLEWGPVRARTDEAGAVVKDQAGRPILEPVPEKRGQTFRRWKRSLERCGYVVEWKIIEAADFGSASRRKRLYVQARRDGLPICWPEATHGKQDHDQDGERGGGGGRGSDRGHARRRGSSHRGPVAQYRAAAEIIDWSDLGRSIFDRPRPLAEKTLARIAEGIRRYVLNDPAPFLLRVTQTGEGRGWKVSSVDDPMPTQTTRQDLAVCTPIIAPQNGGVFGQRVDEPGPTITTKGHQAIIAPVLATTGYGEREGQRPRCQAVGDLLGTAVNGAKQAVVTPVLMHNTTHHTGGPVTAPTPTVTTGGQTGLVAPVLAYLNHGEKQTGGVSEPLRTVVSGGGHAALVAALMIKFYGSEAGGHKASDPLGTVTTRDRHGLVCVAIAGTEYVILDILFRMLKPRELAAAMGFPPGYIWPKTQREAVRLIGNACHPKVVRALVSSSFPRGRIERKAVSA